MAREEYRAKYGIKTVTSDIVNLHGTLLYDNEIEEEIGVDDIRRQLHNEEILEETKHFAEVLKDPALSGTNNKLNSSSSKETPTQPDDA